MVTFKNARHSVEVAREIPLDRLLLETDAPYMAPVPYRGRRNDSAYIPETAAVIAAVRGVTPEEINARIREALTYNDYNYQLERGFATLDFYKNIRIDT